MLGRFPEARHFYDAARVHVERSEQDRVGDDVVHLTVRELVQTLQDVSCRETSNG